MATDKEHPVVTTRETGRLLTSLGLPRERVESALDRGAVFRKKVGGHWVYFASDSAFDSARTAIASIATQRLKDWFLTPTPWLRGTIGKQLDGTHVARGAVEPLLRELIGQRTFGVAGLLTQEYEPYLGLLLAGDWGELTRQLDAIRERLTQSGAVRPRDLPEPTETRELDAWRGHVLSHGEYLGLGSMERGVLVAWDA